jgi:hypothetical protein
MMTEWKPPKDPTSDKGRYLAVIAAVAGAGWVHRQGVAYCKLCEVEAGASHVPGCPVDALFGLTLERR